MWLRELNDYPSATLENGRSISLQNLHSRPLLSKPIPTHWALNSLMCSTREPTEAMPMFPLGHQQDLHHKCHHPCQLTYVKESLD